MIFKPIEEEGKTFVENFKSTITLGLGSVKDTINAFKTNIDFSFDKSYLEVYKNDLNTLNRYTAASVEERSEILKSASKDLNEYINNNELSSLNTEEFTKYSKQQQITLVSSSGSLKNISSLLTEYNNKCQKSGLTTQEFIEAVSKGNGSLGKYLSNLDGAEANINGYIFSLIGAKAATIGLQVASMALNAAISFGIGLAISLAVQGISKLIH